MHCAKAHAVSAVPSPVSCPRSAIARLLSVAGVTSVLTGGTSVSVVACTEEVHICRVWARTSQAGSLDLAVGARVTPTERWNPSIWTSSMG